MKPLRFFSLVLLLLAGTSNCYAETSLPEPSTPTVSQFRLQQQIQLLTNEIPDIEQAIDETDQHILKLEETKKEINSISYDFAESKKELDDVRELLNKWNQAGNVSPIDREQQNLFSRYVNELIEGPVKKLDYAIRYIQSFYSQNEYRLRPNELSPSTQIRINMGLSYDKINLYDSMEKLFKDFDKLERILRSKFETTNRVETNKISSYIVPLLASIKPELNTSWKQNIQAIHDHEKSEAIIWIDEIIKGLVDHKSRLIQKQDDSKIKLDDLDRKYQSQVDQSEKAKQLSNTYEQFSVNFMIGGIILILMILLFMSKGNKEIAEKLIERRTLVEILSMGFLLLAVIILGTSDKINAETLGTLLGTIAGYVFGKQIAERSANSRNS